MRRIEWPPFVFYIFIAHRTPLEEQNTSKDTACKGVQFTRDHLSPSDTLSFPNAPNF